MSSRVVADRVLGDEIGADEIVSRLRASQSGERILRELAGARNVVLRGWVTWAGLDDPALDAAVAEWRRRAEERAGA